MKNYYLKINKLIDKFLVAKSEKGPYRYLVKRWLDYSPQELSSQVLATEYFREELQSIPLPLHKFSRWLVIAPHQDDETIGAGGTLLKLDSPKNTIKILFFTDGAQTNYPGGLKDCIDTRNKEAIAVANKLNATKIDLGVSNISMRIEREQIKSLKENISNLQPEIILTPWILDSPVKHKFVNHILSYILKDLKYYQCEIWGYQVHNMIYPNGIVDITDTMSRKINLLRLYESQNNYSQRYDHLTTGLNSWNSKFLNFTPNSEKKYAELFFTLPASEFIDLTIKSYERNLHETYNDKKYLIQSFLSFKQSLLSHSTSTASKKIIKKS